MTPRTYRELSMTKYTPLPCLQNRQSLTGRPNNACEPRMIKSSHQHESRHDHSGSYRSIICTSMHCGFPQAHMDQYCARYLINSALAAPNCAPIARKTQVAWQPSRLNQMCAHKGSLSRVFVHTIITCTGFSNSIILAHAASAQYVASKLSPNCTI